MLVLTRKPGESIRIADDIKITFIEADGFNIKIGIEAPRSIPVHREEVFQRILEENQKASRHDRNDLQKMADLFKKK